MFIHDTVSSGFRIPFSRSARRGSNEAPKGITYAAEKTAKGAQVRIATRSPRALIAVHEFLRFQIKDHGTGDSLAVQANPSS
jgi:hypothetical protein